MKTATGCFVILCLLFLALAFVMFTSEPWRAGNAAYRDMQRDAAAGDAAGTAEVVATNALYTVVCGFIGFILLLVIYSRTLTRRQ